MHIIIGWDHYTLDIINKVKSILKQKYNYSYTYFWSSREDEQVTLPEFIKPVCEMVLKKDTFGILACGTGAWVCIWANKHTGIRAALCRKPIDAEWARSKDNANILCISSWDTDDTTLSEILDNFFTISFTNKKVMHAMNIMDNWRN